MADPSKPKSPERTPKQRRAVREPVSSIWADLIPSEPELDELDLSSLKPQRGPRTSPALTAGELELPHDGGAHFEGSLQRDIKGQPSVADPELDSSFEPLSELLPPPSSEAISDEFDSFEALDEGLSDHQKEHLRRAREERRRDEQANALDEGALDEGALSAPSQSAERLTEDPALSLSVRRSWLVRFPSTWSTLTLTLLLMLSAEIVSTTPLLEISEVSLNLKGSHVTHEQVTQILKEGGVSQNILTYDQGGFVARLEALPWVKTAEVTRSLPHSLHVQLSEHETAGVVVFRKLHAVNHRGALLAQVTPEQALSLPLISGVPQELFSTPEGSEVGRFLIRRGLQISALYHEMELNLLRPLSEVHVSETGYVELILKRTRVTLGNDDFERHLEDLREVLLTLKRKGVDAHYILLSSDFTRAIVKEAPLRVDDEEASHDL